MIAQEEICELIKQLQKLNWNYADCQGLVNEKDQALISEFVENFNWAKLFILRFSDTFPEGIEAHSPSPYTELSKDQCVSILAALFFCCSSQRHTFYQEHEKTKFKCLNAYFETIRSHPEYMEHILSIELKVLDPVLPFEDWMQESCQLLDFSIDPVEKIEDFRGVSLKADFANRFIGGGVLHGGCVQEEILFSIYPELLISIPLCEVMETNQAIVITGALRVANYTGYAWSFRFASKCQEPVEVDSRKRVNNQFVAIDALMCISLEGQFGQQGIARELNKAYVGFKGNRHEEDRELRPVVTGKWGCGEFGGFPPLKVLLQWIAASKAGRTIVITTFHDSSLQDLEKIMNIYKGRTASELLEQIMNHSDEELFEHLLKLEEKINL